MIPTVRCHWRCLITMLANCWSIPLAGMDYPWLLPSSNVARCYPCPTTTISTHVQQESEYAMSCANLPAAAKFRPPLRDLPPAFHVEHGKSRWALGWSSWILQLQGCIHILQTQTPWFRRHRDLRVRLFTLRRHLERHVFPSPFEHAFDLFLFCQIVTIYCRIFPSTGLH
ncbi:hypothetical protein F5146DRAFT_1052086 [Armillaria mellea]|nr:hypothetical protein F5146DRAFT_1052086 [Armillaria mellea]